VTWILRRLRPFSWRALDEEWIEKDSEREGYDWRPLIVLVTVCVSLTLQEYLGDRNMFAKHFPERMRGEYGVLESFIWWSSWRFLGYVVLPVLVIFLMPGERVRDYFISFRGFFQKLGIYLVLFLLVLPAVLMVAHTPSFLRTYPFYKLANRSAFDLWMWECFYALQFLSLEFFFRGFMLRALAPRFGSSAILVMVVPYCMIHFGKPMPETFGAIVAGLVLGTLALRTRSIWGGVIIHVAVALTMDFTALGHCPPGDSGLPCPRH
jgi:membrane protease YdiL (CAAX protease family)